MQIQLRRHRSGVLVATGLAAVLLLAVPVTGLAQTHLPDGGSTPAAKQAVLEREAHQIAVARAAPRPQKGMAKPARSQRAALPLVGQTAQHTTLASLPLMMETQQQATLADLPHQAAGDGTIVESGQAPFPGSLYTFENRWYQATGQGDLVVYAGAARDDPSQGLVAARLIGGKAGPAAVYHTPMRSGAVRIVGAQSTRLSLLSSSGTRFVFDASSRTFGP